MTTGRINQVDCKPILNPQEHPGPPRPDTPQGDATRGTPRPPAKAEEWLLANKPQRTYLLIRRAVRLDSQTLMYQTPALTCKKRIRTISFPILVQRTTARHRCSARLAINSPWKLGSPAPPRECCCDRPSLGWRATSAKHRGPTAWRGQGRGWGLAAPPP